MTYPETLDYLFSQLPMFQRIGPAAYKKDLTNILALSERLGQPHLAYPCIHIAGTNGKGSVTHLLSAALQAAGYKVGVYTSPHYKDFRERIKVNGAYISEQAVIDFTIAHRDFFETQQPSFFEMATAMAFDHFRNEQVDVAVIETGLGGRLDSTNIITPLLSVITNISFDHQQFLGDTLPLIAGEKAGIIKPGVPVVIGERHEETDPVFINKALSTQSDIVFAQDMVKTVPQGGDFEHSQYAVAINGALEFDQLACGLWGRYQVKNVTTSIAALWRLKQLGYFNITKNNIQTGFRDIKHSTNIMGRWDILSKKPLALADSAHNRAGLQELTSQIKEISYQKLHFVFGMVNDKDPGLVLDLLPKDAVYYFCKADIPRGLPAEDLQEIAKDSGLYGNSYPSVQSAFKHALSQAQPDDLVLVSGSVFVVAEVLGTTQ